MMRAALVGVLLVTACSNDPQSSFSRTKALPEPPLLVYMGGNTSCQRGSDGITGPRGMTSWPQFQALVAKETEGRDEAPAWIASCHRNNDVVHFLASDAPNGMPTSTDFDGFFAKIDVLAAGHKVLVAGHSYGGWLALRAGMSLQSEIGALVSIDPISRPNCSLWTPNGCVVFPSDIDGIERQSIADRSGYWVNYFQRQTSYLHSLPAQEADENPELPASHTSIDTDPAVWTRLGELAAAL